MVKTLPAPLHTVRIGAACLGAYLALTAPALAWVDLSTVSSDERDGPRGIHVSDGSYVMNAGELQINITNWGLIGSHYSAVSTYADAPSGQWPGGSGVEYLWGAGLWVGGVLAGEKRVSQGEYAHEFRPLDDSRDTIYEARANRLVRPSGNALARGKRPPDPGADDDDDGLVDEEVLNGYDDDGDGLVDEDFGQIGDQMLVCTMYDNTPLARELYPDHQPLDLRVIQSSYAWSSEVAQDFVVFDFAITNSGPTEIQDVYAGLFVDCDVGSRGGGGGGEDDLLGIWEGDVQASDGYFRPVSVAYMHDGAKRDPVPGYFGVMFLMPGYRNRIRSFQSFLPGAPLEAGGEPTNDEERYDLMSRDEHDSPVDAGQGSDYRFLVTVGPVPHFRPYDESVPFQNTWHVRAIMVCGEDLDRLKRNCAEAVRTLEGFWVNFDGDPQTGVEGRETKYCLEDFPTSPYGGNALLYMVAKHTDLNCVPGGAAGGYPTIALADLFVDESGKHCIYVDNDNCEECTRLAHQKCTARIFSEVWNCDREDLPVEDRQGCTGIGGAEARIEWGVPAPPTPPGLRIWARDNAVHVYWDDRSEHELDLVTGRSDFESYRVLRADNWDRPLGTSIENGPESDLWQLLAEYDLVDSYLAWRSTSSGSVADTLALGANTGLEKVRYRPVCLDDPDFSGLGEAMQEAVDADTAGAWVVRPALRDRNGLPVAGLEGLLPWESYPAVLDTFFLASSRAPDLPHGRPGKRAALFYEYEDRAIHNGFLYFYSVVATDHAMSLRDNRWIISGPGLSGSPQTSFASAVPGTDAQTIEERRSHGADIYAYPNPATRASLDEFQQLHPNSQDPTGLHIAFVNLPRAHNRIRIFTADGDFVVEIQNDGTGGYGQASWNLVSRNGQQVASGIYLFVVQSDDKRFEDFTGKFVIIR